METSPRPRAAARDLTDTFIPGPRYRDGEFVPRPNYHQARRQKELARKARQLEKQQQRRAAKPAANAEGPVDDTAAPTGAGPSPPAKEV